MVGAGAGAGGWVELGGGGDALLVPSATSDVTHVVWGGMDRCVWCTQGGRVSLAVVGLIRIGLGPRVQGSGPLDRRGVTHDLGRQRRAARPRPRAKRRVGEHHGAHLRHLCRHLSRPQALDLCLGGQWVGGVTGYGWRGGGWRGGGWWGKLGTRVREHQGAHVRHLRAP